MSVADIAWLWAQSRHVGGGLGPRAIRRRAQFMRAARHLGPALATLRSPAPGSALARALAQRPQLVGAVVWPYVCAQWDANARLRHLAAHFEALDRVPALDVAADAATELLSLCDVSPGLRVVLDQPAWFMREGPLVLNLFEGQVRLYSLAFSLGGPASRPTACIGALQGVTTEGVLDHYRALTKALHGQRPRDFLIELFRMMCRAAGVAEILAVADAQRVHRSAYFGEAKSTHLQVDYDEIWRDRGGAARDAAFFTLPLRACAKDLEEVPSKKRAMYRRRYELLAALAPRMAAACTVRSNGVGRAGDASPSTAVFGHVAQRA